MSAADWSKVDLNLLIPLNALLIERNVTKAADRLSVTQPSMSVSLAKLRRLFDDPLLVREGRGLVLTPFAESLRQPVQALLISTRSVLTSGRAFEPAHRQRTFTIVASDYAASVLLQPVLRELPADAPGVRVKIEPLRADFIELLRTGRCDLVLWPLQLPIAELMTFPHATLFTDEFVAVAAEDNDTLAEPLTAETLAAAPSVQVAGVGGNDVVTDKAMAQFVAERQALAAANSAVATVESFMLALRMVAGTELITLAQRRLFDQLKSVYRLREVPVDTDLPRLTEAMFWHPRDMCSPSNQWLRARLQQVASAFE